MIALSAGVCLACDRMDQSSPPAATKSFRFEHQQPRDAFRARLTADGVTFEELPDGTLVFENPRDSRIREAANAITQGFYGYPGSVVEDEQTKDELVAIASARGIRLHVAGLDDAFSVRWDESDDAEVRAIIDEVYDRRRAARRAALFPEESQ